MPPWLLFFALVEMWEQVTWSKFLKASGYAHIGGKKTKSSDKVLQNHSKMPQRIHLGTLLIFVTHLACALTFPIKVIFCVSNRHRSNHFGHLNIHSALPELLVPMLAWLWLLRWPATNRGIGWGWQAGCTKFPSKGYVHTDGVQIVSLCKKQMCMLFFYIYTVH